APNELRTEAAAEFAAAGSTRPSCCCACHASSLCPCALVMPPRRPRSPTRSRWCRLGGGTTGNYFLPSANIPPGPSQEAEKMRPGGHNGWRCSEVAISYIREVGIVLLQSNQLN
uniref:Uncharacterized protein n=2 Tax=Aegilops tauschii subsp. strangulata TaxID=200361 RepID=A0A453R1I2_AEGTS